jgi:hypothetical protein
MECWPAGGIMSRQLQYLYVEKYSFRNKRDDLTYEIVSLRFNTSSVLKGIQL